MKRRYLRELYADRVSKIKLQMPNACIGVDVIVGFPGETHDDFLETYQFLNELNISYLHVFTYSERENTAASEMSGVVPRHERSDRSKMMHILSDKKRRKFYEENLGQESVVLFENDLEDGMMHGFTENYIRVTAKYDPLLINELKKLRLASINSDGLVELEDISSEVFVH
jgi:threonylcarbamoyladenosine tRNA methylthiotransferase MtaB